MAKRQPDPAPDTDLPETGDQLVPEPHDEATTPAADDDPLESLAAELRELQDRHLRLAAEYDNFRKRTSRERLDDRARAQGDLALALLDALDDLARVAHLDPAQTNAADVVAGVELVERKVLKQLGDRGLVRLGTVGEPFDPNHHEAIGSVPTSDPAQDQHVATVFQAGWQFGPQLLRPARVQVYLHQADQDGVN